MNDVIRKATRAQRGVLASEIATRSNDPNFYAGLDVLPNPDTVLRSMNRGQEVYDAIGYDAHVMGELRSVRAGLLAWEWRLQPGGESPADLAAFELCQQVFERRPSRQTKWSDFIWNAAIAVFHGYAIHEVVWQRQDRFIVPGLVIDKPQRRFQFDTDNNLRLRTRNNLIPGDELGDFKWLVTRHMPKHDNPYGVAVFSACFWSYTFKHAGFRYFAKFCERYGIPTPVGKYPPGTKESQITELVNRLAMMIEDAVAAIPNDSSVDLLETKGTGQAMHESFINLCNREMSKALTSQTLATEVQDKGSRSLGEVHHEREEAGQESDREMVAATAQELCDWVTVLNFPPGTIAPIWEFYDEAQTSKTLAQTYDVARAYLDIPVAEAYERLQITPPEENEAVLPRRSNSPAIGDNQDNDPAAFSQCPSCGLSHAFNSSGGDPLSKLAEQADVQASKFVGQMVDQVRELLDEVSDMEEFRDRLSALYPEMRNDQLGEVIALASLTASLSGMAEIDDA